MRVQNMTERDQMGPPESGCIDLRPDGWPKPQGQRRLGLQPPSWVCPRCGCTDVRKRRRRNGCLCIDCISRVAERMQIGDWIDQVLLAEEGRRVECVVHRPNLRPPTFCVDNQRGGQ